MTKAKGQRQDIRRDEISDETRDQTRTGQAAQTKPDSTKTQDKEDQSREDTTKIPPKKGHDKKKKKKKKRQWTEAMNDKTKDQRPKTRDEVPIP
jgi:hypothetical protein